MGIKSNTGKSRASASSNMSSKQLVKSKALKQPRKAKSLLEGGGAGNNDYVLESTHNFFFNCKGAIPAREIASSLLALERIIKTSQRAIEGVTDVEIDGIEVFVNKIETGSLIEDVVVKVFFRDKESFDKFLEKTGDAIRKPGMPRNILIGATIATVIGTGAYFAAKIGNPSGQTTINANNNVIINLGAGQVDLTPETFKAIVETAVSDKKALAKDTVQFFGPARADSHSEIVIDGNQHTKFDAQFIAATPQVVKIDKQEKVEQLVDVDLQIRAMDLDSGAKGWAAVIPGKVDRRVRLKLGEGIKPEAVAKKLSMRADVAIYYKLDKDGSKLKPDYILLTEILSE